MNSDFIIKNYSNEEDKKKSQVTNECECAILQQSSDFRKVKKVGGEGYTIKGISKSGATP